MKKKVMIIDDERSICISLSFALEDEYEICAFTDPNEGLKHIQSQTVDICLLDLKIGQYNGIDVLRNILSIDQELPVIMMTAYGSIESSVQAMREGAFSYLTKPINHKELIENMKKAMDYRELHEKVETLHHELFQKYNHYGMIGNTGQMKRIFRLIEKLKDVDTPVLITGESGTGKELVARAIHYGGKRSQALFQAVNCAAIPENLLEGELFGHKKGSFTGAIENKKGKFECADEGTVFLDEIGDMAIALQGKLLRVLQEKEISPIGSTTHKKINIRIVSATNKDMDSLVEEGCFRPDLYYRLKVIEIHMPSLRERKQDIPLLVQDFIRKGNGKLGKRISGLSKSATSVLMAYDYPGNIRELGNIIEYAMVFADDDIIDYDDLPAYVRNFKNDSNQQAVYSHDLVDRPLREVEKVIIEKTLERHEFRKKETAKILEISEKSLYNKIKGYGIEKKKS